MNKKRAAALALSLFVIGCSNSGANPSGDSVASVLMSGLEPGLSGTMTEHGDNIPWKTSLVSNDPYTIQYTAVRRDETFTAIINVKAVDACKYKSSFKYDSSLRRDKHGVIESEVDFSSLREVKAGQEAGTFKVIFGDSCASKEPACSSSLDIQNIGLSMEKMQKAVSDMKAICKPK